MKTTLTISHMPLLFSRSLHNNEFPRSQLLAVISGCPLNLLDMDESVCEHSALGCVVAVLCLTLEVVQCLRALQGQAAQALELTAAVGNAPAPLPPAQQHTGTVTTLPHTGTRTSLPVGPWEHFHYTQKPVCEW